MRIETFNVFMLMDTITLCFMHCLLLANLLMLKEQLLRLAAFMNAKSKSRCEDYRVCE